MRHIKFNDLVRHCLLVVVCVFSHLNATSKVVGMHNSYAASHYPQMEEVNTTVLLDTRGTANSDVQTATTCEYALAVLDDAVIRVRELKGTQLIIIARLGKGESSTRLNRIRLGLIEKSYLVRFPDLKFVTAEGTRVNSLGVIELYVGGRLTYTLPIKKNAKAYCVYQSKNDMS